MITWTCHICKNERPDNLIGVHRKPLIFNDMEMGEQNIRYCLDNPTCADGATKYNHFAGKRQ